MGEGPLAERPLIAAVRDALSEAERRGREAGLRERLRIPRLPWDQFFMLHAHLTATRSTCDRGPELLLDPGRHGVGAVIVRENRMVAGGYNGSPPGEPHCSDLVCANCAADYVRDPIDPSKDDRGFARAEIQAGRCPICGGKILGGHIMRDGHCVRTLHAEENALLQCALDGTTPEGAAIYTSASACWDCSKRILRAKVARVVFADVYDSRYGLSLDAVELLRRNEVQIEYLDVRDALGWDRTRPRAPTTLKEEALAQLERLERGEDGGEPKQETRKGHPVVNNSPGDWDP